jgi:hypothetical protein
MTYGNIHHIEVVQHNKTGDYKGIFVNMMEASHRAKGIQSNLNPRGERQAIIKRDHGHEWQFLMALHRRDIVSIDSGEGQKFYCVEKLSPSRNEFTLRAHQASTKNNKEEELSVRVNKESFTRHSIKVHQINAIGIIADD